MHTAAQKKLCSRSLESRFLISFCSAKSRLRFWTTRKKQIRKQVQYHMLPPAGAHAAEVETSFRVVGGRLLAVTRVRGRSLAPIVSPVSTPSPPPPVVCLNDHGDTGAVLTGGMGQPDPPLCHLAADADAHTGGGGGGGGADGMGVTTSVAAPYDPFTPSFMGASGMGSSPVAQPLLLAEAGPPLAMMGMVVSSEGGGRVMGEAADSGGDLFPLHFD